MPYCHATPEPTACKICERYVRDPEYAAAIDRVPAPKFPRAAKPKSLPVIPCDFLGDMLNGFERERRGLDSRAWAWCDNPGKPLGDAVCPCKGCGPRCSGYIGELVLVPRAPSLNLQPKSDRAVVTVAAGEQGRELHEISGPWMLEYASRIGADFVVLDWPGVPEWPMSSKYAIPRTLDHYERIAYLDADTMADPAACPNLFDLVAPHEFGGCDELVWHTRQPHFGTEAEYHKLRRFWGFPPVELDWYFNAGVMVLGVGHQSCLEPPGLHMPLLPCAEQHLTNMQVRERGSFRPLPRACNWQTWTGATGATPPAGSIRHFNGLDSHRTRLKAMRSS